MEKENIKHTINLDGDGENYYVDCVRRDLLEDWYEKARLFWG